MNLEFTILSECVNSKYQLAGSETHLRRAGGEFKLVSINGRHEWAAPKSWREKDKMPKNKIYMSKKKLLRHEWAADKSWREKDKISKHTIYMSKKTIITT
jgi:hypothetical protein